MLGRSGFFSAEMIVGLKRIVASIALFGYLNRWNDTMATELEPLAVEVAERTIGPVGWEPGKHG